MSMNIPALGPYKLLSGMLRGEFVSLPAWRRYTLAIALFALALAVRLLLLPLEAGVPFITFYPAVVMAALLLGTGPGMLLVLFGALAAPYYFMAPHETFKLGFAPLLSTSIFIFSAGIICFLAHQVRHHAARLRASEQRLRDFASSSADWFWEQDADLRFTYLSDNFAHTSGWTPEQVLGKSLHQLLAEPPPNASADLAAHGALLEQRLPFRDFEYSFFDAQGGLQWNALSGIPFVDASGRFAGYRGLGKNITGQKERELAEGKANQLLREAVERVASGFTIYDQEDRLVICNETYRQMYARSRDLIVPGARFEDIVRTGAERGQYKEAMGDIAGWVKMRVAKHQHPSGQLIEQQLDDGRWLLIVENRTPNGYIIGNRIDITERKRIETQLLKLSLAVEQSAESIIIADLGGRIEYVNEAFVSISGYSRAEAIGQTMQFLKSGLTPATTYVDLWKKLDAQQPWQGILINQRKNGEIYPERTTITPISQPDGQITHYLAIKEDISEAEQAKREQQRLHRALRLLSDCNMALLQAKDEEKLYAAICRLIVETGGYLMAWIGIAEHDAEKSIRAVAQSGYEEGYLESLHISWDETRETGRGPTGTAIRSAQLQINQNILNNPAMLPWREAAIRRGYQSSIALPLIVQQQTMGALNIYAPEANAFTEEEIALLEELTRNLSYGCETLQTRLRRDAAEAATQAKSAFLANMSHEIRTPMHAILGMAHLMRRDGVTPKQSTQLDKIDNAAEHLLSIINDILDLSKIEAGKLTLEDSDVILEGLLSNVTSILSAKAAAKGLRLLVDSERLPRHLRGDPTRLTQALLNYAMNALKFTAQGTITLRIRLLENREENVLVKFEVEDSGIGIAPDKLARLFTAFEQADNSTTREYGGTGLGLAITRQLAQLMGGQAGASSTPGAGSIFWFTARLGKAAAAPPGTHEHSSAEDSPETTLAREHRGKRVLLAEDDPINQEIAVALLEDIGLIVDVATDGAQALAMAQSKVHDLILMDMQMPKLSGVDATRQIRQLPERDKVPILAMTANAFAEDRERCLHAGMNDFLTKPVLPERLYAMLLKWLQQADLQASAAARHSAEFILRRDYQDKRLLIVDDNSLMREVIIALLSKVWPAIEVAEEGSAAIERVSRQRYDLILMDMQMPQMDGLETTRRIRAQPNGSDVPIIALTANVYPEDRKACLASGMNDLIPKTLGQHEPFTTILKWLQHPSAVAGQ